MAKHRVGVIGCGSMGSAHGRGWRANDEVVELYALAPVRFSQRETDPNRIGVTP